MVVQQRTFSNWLTLSVAVLLAYCCVTSLNGVDGSDESCDGKIENFFLLFRFANFL